MSPLSKPSSNTHRGELYFGAPPRKKELHRSEKETEHSIVPVLTAAQETKLLRKIDLRLLPMITLMYLLSFMDRGNIGNAKLDGLITQLKLTGDKFNVALTMFFIPYSLLEFPSNLAIQVIPPSKWLPGIMVLWGLVMMLMGFVRTYPQLVAVRVCLGAAEAGFYPGVAYYLTMWYPKYKYQYRIAMITAAAAMAGAFSGLLAYAIGFMNGDRGLEGWSWIFILEGVATVLIGLIAAFIMADYPSTAKFLTAEERSFIMEKGGRDNAQVEEHDMSQQVWAAFTDWQVWALAIVQFSIGVPAYGITYFLPTIINNFGYTTSISQLLTVPPYALATVNVLVFAHFSDKFNVRSPFIFVALSIALMGYTINISNAPPGVKYVGTYLCVIGSYTAFPGGTSWLANNLRGKYKRAVGIALQIGVASLGGAVASNIYRIQDEPRYLLGHGLEIMCITIGLVTIPITVFGYTRMNARVDREELALEDRQGQKGDRVPGFRYTL
ncbi:MFS general substrate transporter [Paxillus ammoniavirescens]|nr:MFS general substrate transporter [Paxillus ammoniavirescens]